MVKNNCVIFPWYLQTIPPVFKRESALGYVSKAKTKNGIVKRIKQEISAHGYKDYHNMVFHAYGSYDNTAWNFVWWPEGQSEKFWTAPMHTNEHWNMLAESSAYLDSVKATIGDDNGLDFSYLRRKDA